MSDTPSPRSRAVKYDRLVWIDCEMTGLDPHRHTLLEIAVVVTTAELELVDEGLDLILHATEAQLAEMNDVVREMHDASGLTEAVRHSTLSLAAAEEQILDYLQHHVPVPQAAPWAGSSLHADRRFLAAYLPRLDAALHYRMIDVSSLKELARRWYPATYYSQPAKNLAHRALADIYDSIQELRFYRQTLFVPAPGPDAQTATQVAQSLPPVVGK